MNTIEIKQDLPNIIEVENDQDILEAIRELLQKPEIDQVLQEKLISRALKTEVDFKAGKIYTRAEGIERTNNLIGYHRSLNA